MIVIFMRRRKIESSYLFNGSVSEVYCISHCICRIYIQQITSMVEIGGSYEWI